MPSLTSYQKQKSATGGLPSISICMTSGCYAIWLPDPSQSPLSRNSAICFPSGSSTMTFGSAMWGMPGLVREFQGLISALYCEGRTQSQRYNLEGPGQSMLSPFSKGSFIKACLRKKYLGNIYTLIEESINLLSAGKEIIIIHRVVKKTEKKSKCSHPVGLSPASLLSTDSQAWLFKYNLIHWNSKYHSLYLQWSSGHQSELLFMQCQNTCNKICSKINVLSTTSQTCYKITLGDTNFWLQWYSFSSMGV